MTSEQYSPTYPTNVVVDDKVKDFVAGFYATSDDQAKDEAWVDYFAPEAVLVMGDKTATGVEQIRQVRRGMWEKVKSRKHRPEKVFPAFFGSGSDSNSSIRYEYMLHGSLDFEMKSGEDVVATWAGRAVLKEVGVGDGGGLKFAFYQVYVHNLPAKDA